jgi:hypothetical protein
MKTFYVIPLISAAAVVGPAGAPAAAAPPAATLSLDQIRDGVDAARARIRSLEAETVSTLVEAEGKEHDHDHDHSARANFAGQRIAVLGKLRLVENRHWGPGLPADMDLNFHWVYCDGKTLDLYYPRTRYFETTRANANTDYSWKARGPFLVECLGWWPVDDPSEISERFRTILLHTALRQPDCRVLPEQEEVDGAWCHVVERPGQAKLWLDPAIGFAPRRKEYYAGRPELLTASIRLSDYREAAGGIWFPRKIERTIYDPANPRFGQADGLLSKSVCEVTQFVPNQLDPGRFAFKPPPGTLIQDRDTGVTTQVPGGLELLDSISDTARRILGPGAGPGPPSKFPWLYASVATAALVSIAALASLAMTRRPSGAAPTPH